MIEDDVARGKIDQASKIVTATNLPIRLFERPKPNASNELIFKDGILGDLGEGTVTNRGKGKTGSNKQ